MKLSLAWIFDHIDADWRTIDVAELVRLFNATTAEIEGWQKVSSDLKNLVAGVIQTIASDHVIITSPEWGKTLSLPLREGVEIGQAYSIVKKDNDNYAWASLADFASQKEGLMPALSIGEKDLAGGWKKSIEEHDIILHVDNKSINHRPDMWSHRGVAREISALLNLPFKALDQKLVMHTNKEYESKSPSKESTFTISLENPALCKQFSSLYFPAINVTPSLAWMAARLAKTDNRPLNALVDCTNYVMLDIGQPMHAFDAQTLGNPTLIVRNAKNKETLLLLDGQTIELSDQDCVVADGKKAIALAGIMGGKQTAITNKTKSIVLEAACFDATVIRKTSLRLKKRTESSARFEKSLDPHQTPIALQRFLKLISDAKISYTLSDAIITVTSSEQKNGIQKPILLTHEYIEQLLGISIPSDFVIKTLEKLEFGVEFKDGIYTITIPTFRATKDIAIKQDIVEEIGRFIGYNTINPSLPSRKTKPFDIHAVMQKRRIKQLLAYALTMRELYTYAFFDESFLAQINWQPQKALKVQEAVSHNWQRLVTTLVPNLLKAVQVHANEYDQMNFFEWAAIWPHKESSSSNEQSSLAGIFVNQKQSIDFYDAKEKLCKIAQLLGVHFEWIKADENDLKPWYMPHQTAYLLCHGQIIGIAGKSNPAFFNSIASGDAFIFELNGDFLVSGRNSVAKYTASSKYPSMVRDVSILVPLSVTVGQLQSELYKLDNKISAVTLLDFFEKPEWQNQKSLTFRITLTDSAGTMAMAQADALMNSVTTYLQKQGAQIR